MKHVKLLRKFIPVEREQQLRHLFANFLPVKHTSCHDNIYHCCVWKTASQWVRNVMSASAVYQYSGLLPYTPTDTNEPDITQRFYSEAIPTRRIVSPLYITYENFAALQKPGDYRAFYVTRDPRDIVVSHYFSTAISHDPNPAIERERRELSSLPERDGIARKIDFMSNDGVFQALRSWGVGASNDENIILVRFEDLVGVNAAAEFSRILDHCDIKLPAAALEKILDRLSFARLSGGRKPGEEKKSHKYRKGCPGDWKNYFDDNLSSKFQDATGDLLETLRYSVD